MKIPSSALTLGASILPTLLSGGKQGSSALGVFGGGHGPVVHGGPGGFSPVALGHGPVVQGGSEGGLDAGVLKLVETCMKFMQKELKQQSGGQDASGNPGGQQFDTQQPVTQKSPDKGSPQAGAAQQPAADAKASAVAPTNSDQDVINGDATNGAKSTDKAPAGMTADDIAKLDGGLLGKTGDQTLQGAGADGIKGDKDIQSIVGNQVQGGLSGSDADKAWQKLEVEEQAKNAPQANGQQASADVRHNGNMSGLQPSKEVASNSDLAFLQNEAKGAGQTKGGASDKMDANDGETSGAQQVGQKILDGLGTAAKWLAKIGAKIFPEFAPLIKAAGAGIDVGLHAAGAAANKQDVGDSAKKSAEDELNPLNLLT